jgi:ubiquitin-protein ligase
MHESPRIRRLRNDLAALERLVTESSVLRFRGRGNPVQHYQVEFLGRSLARERGKVTIRERHEVEIKLGSSYPRTMPEIRWQTPIYHPNISEIGMVCLGGYGTHWVPSLNLDELCGMLWDMARYHNYDIRSPYNRDAALWVANQSTFRFPLDVRPLRDLRAALGRIADVPLARAAAPAAEVAAKPARAMAAPGGNGEGSDRLTGRYREFLRKFSDSLHSIEAATVRAQGRPADNGISSSDGTIILDVEVDLRRNRPRPETSEGIVFIE